MQFLFAIAITITKDEDRKGFPQRREEALETIRRGLAKYKPQRRKDDPTQVWFKTADFGFGYFLLDWLKQHAVLGGVVLECSVWDLPSIFGARYVELNPDGNELERNPRGAALNRYPKVLCEECGWYDLSVVEDPFKVSGPRLKPKQEIFWGGHRRFIVTERALGLFRKAAQDQILYGEAKIIGKVPAGCPKDLFWILPRYETGPNLACDSDETCPACGVPRRCWLVPRPGAIGDRFTVDGYGGKDWSIAAVPNWVGEREKHRRTFSILNYVLISGELLAYLLANNLKGLWIPEAGVFSGRREPPIETQRRLAALLPDEVLKRTVEKFQRRKRRSAT